MPFEFNELKDTRTAEGQAITDTNQTARDAHEVVKAQIEAEIITIREEKEND